MKKAITTLAIALVMVPSISFAQTSAETQNALLRQLISLLMQQVQLLQEQLAELQKVEAPVEPKDETEDIKEQTEEEKVSGYKERLVEIDDELEDLTQSIAAIIEKENKVLSSAGCRWMGDGIGCNTRRDFTDPYYESYRSQFTPLHEERQQLESEKAELNKEKEFLSSYLKYTQ